MTTVKQALQADQELSVDICRNLGGAAALGVGIGAAFAASMGPIGYPLGLVAAVAIETARRAISARQP